MCIPPGKILCTPLGIMLSILTKNIMYKYFCHSYRMIYVTLKILVPLMYRRYLKCVNSDGWADEEEGDDTCVGGSGLFFAGSGSDFLR